MCFSELHNVHTQFDRRLRIQSQSRMKPIGFNFPRSRQSIAFTRLAENWCYVVLQGVSHIIVPVYKIAVFCDDGFYHRWTDRLTLPEQHECVFKAHVYATAISFGATQDHSIGPKRGLRGLMRRQLSGTRCRSSLAQSQVQSYKRKSVRQTISSYTSHIFNM